MTARATFRLYCQSSESMPQLPDDSIGLTVTSPPYWDAVDYHIHARRGDQAWYRTRRYAGLGATVDEYLARLTAILNEVQRATRPGGFCAVVLGTLLKERRHLPLPMLLTARMLDAGGWEFWQDFVWAKVTGGVRRAGNYIQKPVPGYFYPNIMSEYILVFRKPGPVWRGRFPSLPPEGPLFTRDIANNIWHIAPVPPHTIDHPCPYPEELARRLILLYSERGDTVLDPFMGSGQTGVAALRADRVAVGYDVEPAYIALARTRMCDPPPLRRRHLVPRYERVDLPPDGAAGMQGENSKSSPRSGRHSRPQGPQA